MALELSGGCVERRFSVEAYEKRCCTHTHRIHGWYIYLHFRVIVRVNVGKYSSTMEHEKGMHTYESFPHPKTSQNYVFINVQWRFEYISLPADFAEYTNPPPEAFSL